MSESDEFFTKEFDALAEDALSFYHVPGLSIGIIHKGKKFAKGYGYSDLESKTPATPKTLYNAASTTKSFAAAALSLLVDDSSKYSAIDYTTPISTILPEDFVLSDPWATEHITFEDGLSHRSGYPRHDMAWGASGTSLSDLVRSLRHLPMTAEPRTEWQYQNGMFIAVSHAIEKLTGMWLGDFLRQRIWSPLGMDSTFFSQTDARAYVEASSDPEVAFASAYNWVPADKDNNTPLALVSENDAFIAEPFRVPLEISGAGANVSSVLDYLKYLECMLNKSGPMSKAAHTELRKERMLIVDPSLEMSDQHPPQFFGPGTYALGWSHNMYARPGVQAVEIWHHAGGIYGFGAEMKFVPALDLGVVTFGNSGGGAYFAGNALTFEVIDNLLGVERKDRFDLKKEYLAKEQESAKELKKQTETLFEGLDAAKKTNGPVDLEEYIGVYEDPGYGKMMLSIVERPVKGKAERERCLRVTPSARTLPPVLELRHEQESWFTADKIIPFVDPEKHIESGAGPGQFNSRSRALFKRDQGGAVNRLGLEWEPSLVEKAAKDGKLKGEVSANVQRKKGRDWEEVVEKGMIWFERVE